MGNNLRLLYSSNAIWSQSGYGVQGRSLLPRLAALPEFGGIQNIAMFAWYGMQGGMMDLSGLRCYPAGVDPYGNDIIESHAKDFKANIVISLIDVWVMKETAKKVAPSLWLPWTPIDHDPVPQAVINALQGAHLTLSYSKWGRDMLNRVGIKNEYIPHGVETNIYCLHEPENVARFRREVFGISNDTHLTVMVAANKGYPDRKAFQVQMRAWANFAKDKPNAKLYLHTESTPMYGGLDLPALIANLGIHQRVLFPDRYQYFKGLPPEYMALMYNAADVYLGNSMAEGFGIPLIEAQACGTPVIVTDFSSMPELVRWGYKIAPADMFWTPMNAWQAWPDMRGITDALNELYEQWDANGRQWPVAQRQKAQEAIHGEYSWDAIVRDNWMPLVARLADEAPQLTPSVNAPLPQKGEVKRIERSVTGGLRRVDPVGVSVNGHETELVAG